MLDVTLEFYGVQVTGNAAGPLALALDGAAPFSRLDLAASVRRESGLQITAKCGQSIDPFGAAVSYIAVPADKVLRDLRPTEADIALLGERDWIGHRRRLYQLALTFTHRHASDGVTATFTPRLPALNVTAFESWFNGMLLQGASLPLAPA